MRPFDDFDNSRVCGTLLCIGFHFSVRFSFLQTRLSEQDLIPGNLSGEEDFLTAQQQRSS